MIGRRELKMFYPTTVSYMMMRVHSRFHLLFYSFGIKSALVLFYALFIHFNELAIIYLDCLNSDEFKVILNWNIHKRLSDGVNSINHRNFSNYNC